MPSERDALYGPEPGASEAWADMATDDSHSGEGLRDKAFTVNRGTSVADERLAVYLDDALDSHSGVPVEGLRELSEKATPGPWRLSDDDPTDVVIWGAKKDAWVANVDERNVGGWLDEASPDAAFIVAAVNYVRSALAAAPREASEPDPVAGMRIATCPHCGEELSVLALGEARALTRSDHPGGVIFAPREASEPDPLAEALQAIEFVHGICPACSGEGVHFDECTTAAALREAKP